MAKQTLKSLLGSSDEREQVELNLNPVALQPTIRSGGNYRVAVQQTPLTNSALQFADSLKQGVQLYGAAVEVSQRKAEQDVASMSEEDFDKFLEQGLDKESLNIFGYTKAYNQALAKKYYAEEMPTKLQAIAAELHKDPYKYKDPAEFEGAAIAAVNEAYDEADELLGGNVFSEQANNALKSATKADFVAKQQATYLAKLPEITRKVQADVAFKAFSEIDDVANVKKTIDQQILAVASAVGNKKDAAAIVTKAYLDNIEALAKQEGKEELAQALLDELDDTTVAGLGSQGRRKFGKDGIELFNTSANRLRIEKLEDDIENAGVAGYNANIARAREAQAGLELEAFGLIAEANGDETTALARFEEIEADIRNGSVTINGVTYKDTVELNEIRKFIAGARSNKDLFVHNAKLSFVQQNTGGKRAAVNALTTQGALASINEEAAARLVSVKPNSVTGGMDVVYTPEGATFLTDFNREVEQLELQLADSLLGDTSLSVGERITEYSKLYPSEVTAKMQDWISNRLNSMSPATLIEVDDPALTPEETEALNLIAQNPTYTSQEEIKEAQKEYLTDTRARQEVEVYITGSFYEEGTTQVQSRRGRSFRKIDPETPYKKGIANGFFKDSEEQANSLDTINGTFNSRSGTKRRPRNALILRYNQKENFPTEDTVLQQAEKKADVRESLALYGLSLTDVANDELAPIDSTYKRRRALNKPIMLSSVYGSQAPFLTTPILIDGSIQNTINIVQEFKDESPDSRLSLTLQYSDTIRKAASVYGLTTEEMLNQMYTYLLTNNFISK